MPTTFLSWKNMEWNKIVVDFASLLVKIRNCNNEVLYYMNVHSDRSLFKL